MRSIGELLQPMAGETTGGNQSNRMFPKQDLRTLTPTLSLSTRRGRKGEDAIALPWQQVKRADLSGAVFLPELGGDCLAERGQINSLL